MTAGRLSTVDAMPRTAIVILLAWLSCTTPALFAGPSAPQQHQASAPAANAANRALQEESPVIEQRIRRVERGLVPTTRSGRPAPRVGLLERMKRLKVPGASVAVINRSAIEWIRAYGVVEAGTARRVTTETLFQAAAISRPVAAVAALRLVEEGKLSLDEDVNTRLRSWKVPENENLREQKVTLRRILSNSAGLTVSGFRGYAITDPLPTLVQVLDGSPPANSPPVTVELVPGSRWRYSAGGFAVLQQLLVDVTGRPFPQFARDAVLERAGMRHSTFDQPLPASLARSAATGHLENGSPIEGRWHVYPEAAAAGLWSTPSDLAHFAIAIERARAGESRRLLSERMIEEVLTRQIDHWGLGLRLDGTGHARRFSHSGSNDGYRCLLVAYAQTGQGAVVMTNSDNGAELAQELMASIARVYGWPDYLPRRRTGERRPRQMQEGAR